MSTMLLKSTHAEKLEAVPIVAADVVVCRSFKVVDEFGTVRIEATVDDRGNGPDAAHFYLYGRDGKLLVDLSVDDDGCGSELGCLWVGNSDNENCGMICASTLMDEGAEEGQRVRAAAR